MALTACSDAVLIGEEVLVHEQKEPHQTQQTWVCLLFSSECLAEEGFLIYLTSYNLTIIRHVFTSTMTAETCVAVQC